MNIQNKQSQDLTIVMGPGNRIVIGFEDTDGHISIEYGEKALRVIADLPDSSGREGCVYEENFSVDDEHWYADASEEKCGFCGVELSEDESSVCSMCGWQ